MPSVTARTLDRELVDVIDRLTADFPDVSIATIVGVVEAAAPRPGDCDVGDLPTITAAVEASVRQWLLPRTWHVC